MKKILISFFSVFLVLLLVAPTFLSVVSFAAEESESESFEDLYHPAYMKAEFSNVAERIIGNDVIKSMECRLVTNGYALYCDALTGEIICLKLAPPDADGNYTMTKGVYDYVGYYTTNPYSTGKSKSSTGSATSESIKQSLLSQLLVKYTENSTEVEFNSYNDAAKNGQITIKNIRSGLRVEYTLGREEVSYLVPRRIRYDKWVSVLSQISENAPDIKFRRKFAAYYTIKAISPDQIFDTIDKSSLTLSTQQYLYMTRAQYNEMSKDWSDSQKLSYGYQYGVTDYIMETVANSSNKSLEKIKEEYPFVENFAFMVIDGTVKAAELRRCETIIKLYTTYTKEQLNEDHAETEYVGNDKIPALFKMAIEYTINDYGLQIRLNAGNVRFDNSNYKLSNISLLPYGGAADTNNGGYLFTPDGSGSLIMLKDIYGNQFTSTTSMYGQDYAYHTITGANKESVRFPAFGAVEVETIKETYMTTEIVVNEDGEEVEVEVEKTRETSTSHGYFGIITDGDSLSKITVVSGGALHMFASIYTTFNPRPKDSYVLNGGISAGSDAMWTVESKRKYTGDYKLQIFILDNDTASYSGMAQVYRKYLEDKEVITKLTTEDTDSDDIPLYIKALGALESTKTILGIPMDTIVPLTSFNKALEMLKKLSEGNIKNVKLILEGWANEGLFTLVPNGVDLVDELGGEDAFRELIEYCKSSEAQLFPNFDFAFAQKDKAFDGFSINDDLAKTIDNRDVYYKEYDPVWQGYLEDSYAVISANVMEKFYNNTYAEYEKYNIGGIAVTTLGEVLTSDFNEDDPLNREDSKTLVIKLLSTIKEQNGKVLVSGGNAYTLPYVTDIVDLSLEDSRSKYAKASVPFYGMVLHGYKEFAGTPINLAGNYQYTLLKTIENGASPYFIIAIENTSELKQYSSYSSLNQYYSVKYSIWLKDMVNTYNELNQALKSVKYSTIVKHEFVDDLYKVAKVTYDTGDVFYINYLIKDFTIVIDGVKTVIPAQNFVKIPA